MATVVPAKTFDQEYVEIADDLEALLREVEAIGTWNLMRTPGQLRRAEAKRARIDARAAALDRQHVFNVLNTPINVQVKIAVLRSDPVVDAVTLTHEALRGLGSATQGTLSVLRLQQKSQAVGAVIERKYAYVIGIFSLYVAVIALVLGLYPIWHDWQPEKPTDPGGGGDVAGVVEAPPRLAIFPILFASNAQGAIGRWTAGVTLDEASQRELKAISWAVFSGCAAAAARTMVRLTAAGFASSAEFANRPRSDSSALNLDVANRRAREVASLLETLRDQQGLASHVAIETQQWLTFAQMAEHRPFNDRAGESTATHDQEVFNRVVQVQVSDAGACERPK